MQDSFVSSYINESKKILSKINHKEIEKITKILLEIKRMSSLQRLRIYQFINITFMEKIILLKGNTFTKIYIK